MSVAFNRIKQSLQEAIAHAKGETHGVRVYRPREVELAAQKQASRNDISITNDLARKFKRNA